MKDSDRLIGALIDEAQRHANPSNRVPNPPSGLGAVQDFPPEIGQRERPRTPTWFDPRDHPPVSDGANYPEVPVIAEGGDVPPLSESEETAVGSTGADALAYYAPFHFYGATTWGIYIRDIGLLYLLAKFKNDRRISPADNLILRCAYFFLWQHEYFRFQTEVAATRFEALSQNRGAYSALFYYPSAAHLEEALANARAFRNLGDHEKDGLEFSDIENFKGFGAAWMKGQSAGYNEFDLWCKGQTFDRGATADLRSLVGSAPLLLRSTASRSFLPPLI